ncbi:MAG: CPBP family intramembrane glutamic endopeptidase [Eubacteriaceae bacterium]
MNIFKKNGFLSGLWIFFIFFIIFLIGNIVVGFYFYDLALYHEFFDILIPCLIYLVFTKKPIIPTLRLNKSISKKSCLIIFQLFLVSFLLKIGINYLVLLTGTIDPSAVTTQVAEMVPSLFVFFISVAVIPVFLEEIAIRGVVLDKFRDTSLWQSAVVTGVLFGIMHVDLGQFGYATALGIIMGGIVIATGSLWGGIFFHFLNNFFTFLMISIIDGISKLIPENYMNEFLQSSDSIEYVVEQNNMEIWYGLLFAIISLILGIYLTIYYVEKLKKINNYEEKRTEIKWAELFINVPFILIIIFYISINIILRIY